MQETSKLITFSEEKQRASSRIMCREIRAVCFIIVRDSWCTGGKGTIFPLKSSSIGSMPTLYTRKTIEPIPRVATPQPQRPMKRKHNSSGFKSQQQHPYDAVVPRYKTNDRTNATVPTNIHVDGCVHGNL